MASTSGCNVEEVFRTNLARFSGETVPKMAEAEAKGLPCTSFLDPSVATTAMMASSVSVGWFSKA